jgi:predicted Zn-dependent protease with MMP-like domain
MANPAESDGLVFGGRMFAASEIAVIGEVVASCRGLSRKELANTVSELLDWRRANGSLKGPECLQLLERLQERGVLGLPAKRQTRPAGSATSIPRTRSGEAGATLSGPLEVVGPVSVERVAGAAERQRFREWIDRHHPLGYKVPFGAHLEYLIRIQRPVPAVAGCLQFSSAAWRIKARDRWIGWDDSARARHLQQVVNNSRFLVMPWVRIKNLASAALAQALRCLPADWQAQYGVAPLLVETFVDAARYSGVCYRAANWVEIGQTSGRGRTDRQHLLHGAQPKRVFVYRLRRDAQARLRGDSGRP